MTYKEVFDLMHAEMPELQMDIDEEAINVILDALEKQIPRKPEEYWDGYANGYPVIEYQCPCCGRDIDDMDHHCECGQAIDWSEEE